jgi:hypothetical protein
MMAPLDSLLATRRVGAEPDGGERRLPNVRRSAVLPRVPIHFEQPTDVSLTPPEALGHPLGRGLFRFGRYQCFFGDRLSRLNMKGLLCHHLLQLVIPRNLLRGQSFLVPSGAC